MDTTCRNSRIALCVPAYGGKICAELVNTILLDYGYAGRAGHKLAFFWLDMQPVDRARNRAVQLARAEGFDFLYMLDADVYAEPTESVLEQLMCSVCEHDATAVMAAVVCRGADRLNVHPAIPGDVYEAEKGGAAMLLVDLAKLDELEPDRDFAWFQFQLKPGGVDAVGEDVYFAKAIRERGGRYVCNYQIPTRHLSTVPLKLEHFTVSGPQNPVGSTPSACGDEHE